MNATLKKTLPKLDIKIHHYYHYPPYYYLLLDLPQKAALNEMLKGRKEVLARIIFDNF
jgi:hypothetical protein